MKNPPSPTRKWLIALAKLVVLGLVVWFVRGTLIDAWRQLGDARWRLDPWWLAAAGAMYLLGLLPAGLFWWRVLGVYGQQARLTETLRAYYIGHLGKYVPGKAMVVVLRAGLIRRPAPDGQTAPAVDTRIAAASVFVETLTMMAVGACLAATTLAVRLRDERALFWGAIGLAVVAGLPTIPPIFRRMARLAGVGQGDPDVAARLDRLGWGGLLLGWAAMLVTWLGLAASLWATLAALHPDPPSFTGHLAEYTAAVSLAMVAGFLSLIPGGIGIRDVILIKLVVRLFPLTAAEAAVASGLLRLVWLVSELIVSGILYMIRRPPAEAVPPREPPPHPGKPAP